VIPPPRPDRIPVAQPLLDGREAEYVRECLETGWISSNGRFITAFEDAFASYCGVKHAVAVSNGTTALHLALVALDLRADEEVVVPALTYIASANAVSYCQARPVFADSAGPAFNLDPQAIEDRITPRTRGIMPVHLYGHPVDMDPVNDIARRHGLFVIEDAAEAIGATYKRRRTGGLGDVGIFSFFGNKIITTGEGGMVTTNDDSLAARLRLYRSQGMDPTRRYWFPVIGYNYRMTNIAAAIGLGQLERIESHLETRRRVAEGYDLRLARLGDKLVLPTVEPWATHAYWMYTVLLRQPGSDDDVRKKRDAVIDALDHEGIETRPLFYPMTLMPPYQEPVQGPFPNAEAMSARGINLPTHAGLSDLDMDRIVSTLSRVLAQMND
jgi:perosamine synthetase